MPIEVAFTLQPRGFMCMKPWGCKLCFERNPYGLHAFGAMVMTANVKNPLDYRSCILHQTKCPSQYSKQCTLMCMVFRCWGGFCAYCTQENRPSAKGAWKIMQLFYNFWEPFQTTTLITAIYNLVHRKNEQWEGPMDKLKYVYYIITWWPVTSTSNVIVWEALVYIALASHHHENNFATIHSE